MGLSNLFSLKAQSDARAARREQRQREEQRRRVAEAEDVIATWRTDYGKALIARWRRELESGLDALEGANDFEKGVLAARRKILRAVEADLNEAEGILNGGEV